MGALFKYKVGLAAGVGFEGQLEVTFDFGYTNSKATTNTTTDGERTVGSLSIDLKPEDRKCAVISIMLQRTRLPAYIGERPAGLSLALNAHDAVEVATVASAIA